jgi:REP element-mobilizing transposase RayT
MPSTFSSQRHHRHSSRIKGYDYASPAAYFITIVTYQRECLFGEIKNGRMILNELGKIIERAWNDLVNHYRNIELGIFVIMPNHVHGIIVIKETNLSRRGGSETRPYAIRKTSWSPRNCPGIQIVLREAYQRTFEFSRYAPLATQLLRTYYPQRT